MGGPVAEPTAPGPRQPGYPFSIDRPSPYARPITRPGRQSRIWLGVHVAAFVGCAAWLLLESLPDSDEVTIPVAVLVSSIWLIVGPMLVMQWERSLTTLDEALAERASLGPDAVDAVRRSLASIRHARLAVISLPVMLVVVAYLAGDEFFGDELSLPRSGVVFVLGLVVMALGGLAAGCGLWQAVLTVWLAIVLPRQIDDFEPFAGTTSRSSRDIASFCFAAARAFGLGGAILLPSLAAALWALDDSALAALVAAIVLIIGGTISLIAVPAWTLSRRNDDARVDFLDRLSAEVDDAADAAIAPNAQMTDEQYARLRALLEIRTHVAAHTVSQPSIELVKRIPAAVVLPLLSILASWVSLFGQ